MPILSDYKTTALAFMTLNQNSLLRKPVLVDKDNGCEVTILISSDNLSDVGLLFPSANSSLFSNVKITHSWIQQSNFERTGSEICTSVFNYTLKTIQRLNYQTNNNVIKYTADVNTTPYTILYSPPDKLQQQSSLYMSTTLPKLVKLTFQFE